MSRDHWLANILKLGVFKPVQLHKAHSARCGDLHCWITFNCSFAEQIVVKKRNGEGDQTLWHTGSGVHKTEEKLV
jgi:hypothetical protein